MTKMKKTMSKIKCYYVNVDNYIILLLLFSSGSKNSTDELFLRSKNKNQITSHAVTSLEGNSDVSSTAITKLGYCNANVLVESPINSCVI